MNASEKYHLPKYSCYYCGKPATCFCDGVEHYNGAMLDGVPRVSMDDADAVTWCERPLCDEHCEIVGMSTVSGKVDTVDYCPKHMTMQKLGESPKVVCI